jgi:hypothetical protein
METSYPQRAQVRMHRKNMLMRPTGGVSASAKSRDRHHEASTWSMTSQCCLSRQGHAGMQSNCFEFFSRYSKCLVEGSEQDKNKTFSCTHAWIRCCERWQRDRRSSSVPHTLIALPSAFVYQLLMRYPHATLFPRLCLQQSVLHVRLLQPTWPLTLPQRLRRLWSPPCHHVFFFFAYPKRQHHLGGEAAQIVCSVALILLAFQRQLLAI